MHWHEDLQFIYGAGRYNIEVRTLDTSVLIQALERRLFINKNVVHDVRRNWKIVITTVSFSQSYFLEFYAGSPAKDFVDSVIHQMT